MADIRFITAEEITDFYRAMSFGFGEDSRPDAESAERLAATVPLKTSMVAFDHDRMVATFASHDLELTVPGAELSAAGTTMVTVQPTHRRQGILRTMMERHLRQAIERGQSVAALWASEETIYGRFGYGQACFGHRLTIPSSRVTAPEPPPDVRIRVLDAEEAAFVLPSVYDTIRPTIAGLFGRSEIWWADRHFRDPEHKRAGASKRRHVVAERAGEPVGYTAYRQREKWGDEGADGVVELVELFAVDDDARRALWSYLFHIDLYPTLSWENAPIDEPLFFEVGENRRVKRTQIDTMWIRILDVVEALQRRRYEHDGSIVITVDDPFLDSGGTFALAVADGDARCAPTAAPADVELGIAELSALFLGGRSAHTMARAGRIGGDGEAVKTLHDLFRTAAEPFCAESF